VNVHSELTQLVTGSLIGPLVFMVMCMIIYIFVGMLLYYYLYKPSNLRWLLEWCYLLNWK